MSTCVVTYEEMVEFENNKDVLIIDVREPDEISSTGKIRGSINIPLNQLENAFKRLNNEEFQERYKAPKPSQNFPLVFSCKLGGRAEKAMKIALDQGFSNSKFYKGSWNEWSEKRRK